MTTVQLTFVSREGMEFNDSQKAYFENVSNILQDLINTTPFKDAVRYFKYKKGRKWYQKFKLNKGLSNVEILDFLLLGKDPYDTEDYVLNIHLNPYYKKKLKYKARTFKGRRSIGINTTYLNHAMNDGRNGEANMSRTLIHEYLHIIGFSHYTNSGKKKDMATVPWGIGNKVRELLKPN